MQIIQIVSQFMVMWSILGTLLMCFVFSMDFRSIPEDLCEIIFGILVFLGGPIAWLTLLFGKIDAITSV